MFHANNNVSKSEIVKRYCRKMHIPYIDIKLNKICSDVCHWIYWIKTGLYFKYPLCCILFFIIMPRILLKRYNYITNKDGYVPCPIHRFIFLSKYGINNKNFKIMFNKVVIVENL